VLVDIITRSTKTTSTTLGVIRSEPNAGRIHTLHTQEHHSYASELEKWKEKPRPIPPSTTHTDTNYNPVTHHHHHHL